MRMLTEKVIRKIWSRCIGAADSCISEYDFYLSTEQREDILKYLTSQKESLLTRIPEGATLSREQINKIEADISKELKGQTHKLVMENALPNMKSRLKLLETMTDQLELLKNKVQRGGFQYKGLDKSGWGGADVIVTADTTIDPKKSHDIIVLISNPRPLTRLMESLRDICKPILNHVNKYGFYGMIAEISNQYISEKGDPGNEQAEMLELVVNAVMELIGSEKEWTETRFKTRFRQLEESTPTRAM
jgi:hypothetical protein